MSTLNDSYAKAQSLLDIDFSSVYMLVHTDSNLSGLLGIEYGDNCNLLADLVEYGVTILSVEQQYNKAIDWYTNHVLCKILAHAKSLRIQREAIKECLNLYAICNRECKDLYAVSIAKKYKGCRRIAKIMPIADRTYKAIKSDLTVV